MRINEALGDLWGGLLTVGERPSEGADERVSRQTLVLGGVLMSFGGLLWGALAIALTLMWAAIIPLGYVVISAINLRVLARDRAFARARTLQVLISMLLPFFLQWVVGGFVASGGVMLWAIIALVGSLTLSSVRDARMWLGLYCLLTVLSGVLDADLAAHAPLPPDPQVARVLFVANIATISSIVFTLGLAITQRQRRAIKELEAGQRARRDLTQKLTETVTTREEDIERLRAAEAALKDLANSLEAQVATRTAELETALVRAEAGTRAKGEFLAVMSHEIRTPLNGILGTADLLQLTTLDEEQGSCVKLIRRSGDLLLSIINDVLDFSKIEAGRLELAPRPFHLRAELEGVAALHRSGAAERGVELVVDLPRDLPEMVVADVDRLLQITGNLLGNAVKFTHEGAITLRVAAQPSTRPGALRLELSITDTGIGIAPEHLHRLFQPFSQADSSTTRRYGGTGLGLVICARMVDMMGGHITVDSEVGVGTTFRFDLEALHHQAGNERGEAVGPAPGHDEGLGLRVLLAEDNPVNQAIGLRLLRSLGCEASVAGDGQVAAAMVSAAPYDLIFMDMQMPVVDGITSTRMIRKLTLERQPRIVALTANAYAADRQACIDAGMDDFMAKPLRLEQLRAQLRTTDALRARAANPRPARGPATDRASAPV